MKVFRHYNINFAFYVILSDIWLFLWTTLSPEERNRIIFVPKHNESGEEWKSKIIKHKNKSSLHTASD